MRKINIITYLAMISLLFFECSSGKEDKTDEIVNEEVNTASGEQSAEEDSEQTVIVSETKEALLSYYEIPHIKEFYGDQLDMKYIGSEALQVPADLSGLSYGDLRLLRNEIFARNGHLFTDGFLRGHFNKFKWYMPIFDVDTFKIVMSTAEQTLVNDLLKEEDRRKENRFVNKKGLQLYNADLVVNTKQFKSANDKIIKDLAENNFSIVNANRQMPFYVYDKNAYQFIPHYITTDLYLFILHKYFSKFLEKLDENYMAQAMNDLLNGIINEIGTNPRYKNMEGKDWVSMYAKTARFALTGIADNVSDEYKETYEFEQKNIIAESGKPSFIKNNQVAYSELKPRGHYTKSDTLKNYFKSFKWISLNGIELEKDKELKGMILMAFIIKSNPDLYQKYEKYTSTIEKLAGQEDNISIRDIIQTIGQNLNEELSDAGISKLKSSLGSLNKERIKKVFGNDFIIPERDKTRIYFLSSTYSVSGDIFSKLVHVNGENSKRPFPKGLDIPAVFRNKTAQNIILNEYKDGNKWPEYQSRLTTLQNQFDDFEGWDSNYGVKSLKTALTSIAEQERYPDFMKTDAYNRKELSTMLSSWTHIKHDLILYQEKPYAAEAGQGGGPEPPKHYSYVEPNIEFWNESLKLANWLKTFSKLDNTFEDELQSIIDIGYDLKTAANKQLKGEKLTMDELSDLAWIGGRIEYTLLGLLETDHIPEREKSMALIADVYSYNSKNLNVAVGHADDIYVLVPIDGEYHIARGSVFSYFEFQDDKIYNDEEWRKMNQTDNTPKRPDWMKPLINNIAPLEGQMEYRYSGY
jgi:hypothetical protein